MYDLRFLDSESLVNRAAFNERFGKLNELYTHWWRRRKKNTLYEIKKTPLSVSNYETHYITHLYNSGPKSGYTKSLSVNYSDAVVVNEDQTVELAEPIQILTYSYDNYADMSVLKGKFVQQMKMNNSATKVEYGSIFYIPASAVAKRDVNSVEDKFWTYFGSVETLSAQPYETYGGWEYVQSSEKDTYPDFGEKDGYVYKYIGIPFDNAVGAPKIETGSYVGTGTHGQSNPNSLTFGLAPSIVVITKSGVSPVGIIYCQSLKTEFTAYGYFATINGNLDTGSNFFAKLDGKTVSWYLTGGSESTQLNWSGETYNYFAIG